MNRILLGLGIGLLAGVLLPTVVVLIGCGVWAGAIIVHRRRKAIDWLDRRLDQHTEDQ